MPEVYVHAVKGRFARAEEGPGEGHHRRGGEEFAVPADAVVVSIIETEASSKSKGGVLFSEMKR